MGVAWVWVWVWVWQSSANLVVLETRQSHLALSEVPSELPAACCNAVGSGDSVGPQRVMCAIQLYVCSVVYS